MSDKSIVAEGKTVKIYVIDTESTGLDPAVDRVVEIAAVELTFDAGSKSWNIEKGRSSFVNPGRPIPPEASGVHHIVDIDVANAPGLDEALEAVLSPAFMVDVVSAHNCRFEIGFLPKLKDRRWIDTYRAAMHVWPEAPNFKNQTLRYWLGLDLPLGAPHRALGDAIVTAHILRRLLAERTLEELLILSRKAVLLKKVGFGKHFGMLWTETPTSYLEWANGAEGLDPDVKFTVKKELARRRGSAA